MPVVHCLNNGGPPSSLKSLMIDSEKYREGKVN